MKRRKITINIKVVSVAFLILSVLMLATVSYAYFTAQVEGNEKAKVTEVTAGEMKLKYDGKESINIGNILPGEKRTSTFTVENIGTVATQYNVDLTEVTNGFLYDELVYSLKRDGNEEIKETPLPKNNTTLLEGIDINVGKTDTYELTIELKETGSNQNYNQKQNFSGKIKINEFSPYKTILGVSYLVIQEGPSSEDFAKGCPTSEEDECSGLYKMADDDGTSYYFRGAVENNYVKLSSNDNNLWRIVRINGDGTIRLVLDGDIGTSKFNNSSSQRQYVGYTYGNSKPCTNTSPCTSTYSNNQFNSNNVGTNSTIKSKLENWYLANLKSYDKYITYGTYCNDTSYRSGSETSGYLYYGARERFENGAPAPQLTCPDPKAGDGATSDDTKDGNHTYGGVYKLKIGLLSGDEIALAGFQLTYSSPYPTTSNYLYYTGGSDFWSSSPYSSSTGIAYVFSGLMSSSRSLNRSGVNNTNGVRPVINLKTYNLNATGEGTQDEPFVISPQ